MCLEGLSSYVARPVLLLNGQRYTTNCENKPENSPSTGLGLKPSTCSYIMSLTNAVTS